VGHCRSDDYKYAVVIYIVLLTGHLVEGPRIITTACTVMCIVLLMGC